MANVAASSKKMIFVILGIVAVLAIVAVIGIGFCHKDREHRSWGHEIWHHKIWGEGNQHLGKHERHLNWIVEKVANELELNETQQQTLKQIKKEILVKKKEVFTNHGDFLKVLIEETSKDSIDVTHIRTSMNEKKAHMETMAEYLLQKYVEFHQILTPKQRTKLASKMEEHYKHRINDTEQE